MGSQSLRTFVRLTLSNLFCALVYFGLGRAGLKLSFVGGSVSPIWLPSGLAVALVLARGSVFLPSVAIGVLATTLSSGASLPASLGMAAGNVLEAWIAAHFLRRQGRLRIGVRTVRDVLALAIVGCLIAAPIASTIGCATLMAVGSLAREQAAKAWLIWTVGDALGIILLTPLLLLALSGRYRPELLRMMRRPGEVALLTLALVASLSAALVDPLHLAFAIFPVIFWVALRFGQSGVALAVLLATAITSVASLHGIGPFDAMASVETLAWLDLYIGFLALSGMLVAAALHAEAWRGTGQKARTRARHQARELRETKAKLRQAEARLGAVVGAADMLAWEWSPPRGFSLISSCKRTGPDFEKSICAQVLPILESGSTETLATLNLGTSTDTPCPWWETRWRHGENGVVTGICVSVADRKQLLDERDELVQREVTRTRQIEQLAANARQARREAEAAMSRIVAERIEQSNRRERGLS